MAGSRPHLGQSGDKLERKSRDQPSIAGAFERLLPAEGIERSIGECLTNWVTAIVH